MQVYLALLVPSAASCELIVFDLRLTSHIIFPFSNGHNRNSFLWSQALCHMSGETDLPAPHIYLLAKRNGADKHEDNSIVSPQVPVWTGEVSG